MIVWTWFTNDIFYLFTSYNTYYSFFIPKPALSYYIQIFNASIKDCKVIY